MFFKQVCAYAPPLVERVGQLGINKNIGIISTEAGRFLQTSLKEIFAVGKNPPGEFTYRGTVRNCQKQGEEIKILHDKRVPLAWPGRRGPHV